MGKKQIKSKERVAEHGEASPMSVKSRPCAILVKDETERIDSRVLEIKTRYLIYNS